MTITPEAINEMDRRARQAARIEALEAGLRPEILDAPSNYLPTAREDGLMVEQPDLPIVVVYGDGVWSPHLLGYEVEGTTTFGNRSVWIVPGTWHQDTVFPEPQEDYLPVAQEETP